MKIQEAHYLKILWMPQKSIEPALKGPLTTHVGAALDLFDPSSTIQFV